MLLHLRLTLSLSFCLLASNLHAKTLHIPADAGSVKEAVEMAMSGDEIVIDSSEVDWIPDSSGGILIKNKNLTITGASQYGQVKVKDEFFNIPSFYPESPTDCTLRVEGSHVILRNLAITSLKKYWFETNSMQYIASAPVYLTSGSLTIQNCVIRELLELNGSVRVVNSEIGGSRLHEGRPYYSYYTGGSSVLIHSASNALIEMENATIGSLELRSLLQSEIRIRNSRIAGGKRINHTRWHEPIVSPGENGISMTGCRETLLDLTGSEVKGGQGWGAPSMEGGDGIRMDGCDITLLGGHIVGGSGAAGYGFGGYASHTVAPSQENRPTGRGGHGLVLLRSHVLHGNGELIGGPGSPEGQRLVLDELSTFQEITSLSDWSIH